ncbi:MAG: hypothetical protein ACF8MJ_11270 [Phycisphaerales bacterium JB050]
MRTNTNPIDPDLLDAVLKALLDEDATFPSIAADLNLSIADLLAFIEQPEVQQTLVRLRTALTQRAEIVALSSETAALQTLATVGKDLDDIAAERDAIEEKAKQTKPDDKAAQAELDRARKRNDKRSRDRIESARAARNTLAHARKRTTRAHDALPQALKLAMPVEA